MNRVKDSPPNKRLSLIYLANGTHSPASPRSILLLTWSRGRATIQSPSEERIRSSILASQSFISVSKTTISDVLQIMAEGTAAAYKGAPYDIQQRIRRVIEVWRQRQIFDTAVQDQVEKSLDGKLWISATPAQS